MNIVQVGIQRLSKSLIVIVITENDTHSIRWRIYKYCLKVQIIVLQLDFPMVVNTMPLICLPYNGFVKVEEMEISKLFTKRKLSTIFCKLTSPGKALALCSSSA